MSKITLIATGIMLAVGALVLPVLPAGAASSVSPSAHGPIAGGSLPPVHDPAPTTPHGPTTSPGAINPGGPMQPGGGGVHCDCVVLVGGTTKSCC